MRILNFGSLNIDHVYRVDEFVRPGETLGSASYRRFCGGKGANQSIALARAGARVFHAGKIGKDGIMLKDRLERDGVDTSFLQVADEPTGHAIIQVNSRGENAIILYGGANRTVTGADAEKALAHFHDGEYLLLQNEISSVPEIMEIAHGRGLQIVLNPAPMTAEVLRYPLDLVRYFVVNEIEGSQLSGESDPDRIMSAMRKRFPGAAVVLTLGAEGARYSDSDKRLAAPAEKVKPVDTTAAGDTFIGFFVAEIMAGRDVESALKTACKAAAICVTRPGAADSIPSRSEVG